MSPRPRPSAGFSLLELLLVIAVVAILAAIALPSGQSAVVDQLRSTARIVATDLAYARSLAVSNNSNYKIAFELNENRYVLTHSGSNASLDNLPVSPFSSPGDTPNQHVVDLDELPRVGPTVRLAAVTIAWPVQTVGDVEFGPLGQTTRPETTTVWLTAGSGLDARYIALEVNPITGMIGVGVCTSEAPPHAAE